MITSEREVAVTTSRHPCQQSKEGMQRFLIGEDAAARPSNSKRTEYDPA